MLESNPTDKPPPTLPGRGLLHLLAAALALSCASATAADHGLKVSVYCTAGGARAHLLSDIGRQEALVKLQSLGATRLFLEGRRGDEYVSAEELRTIRDFFQAHQIECSGGIATVPGSAFGVRQTGGLSWLSWESPKVRQDIAGFFTENAPVFRELIVDDFYCTGDVSPESEAARAGRSWDDYRRDLMVSLIQPMIVEPTRAANRKTRLIIKFPQWYDRFHLFGYDPARMSAYFDQVWVGTEVRDPRTRRMGFVQPTQGYMNYQWLRSIAGRKVVGAWFDHIECSAQNFVDQAFASVLAGAQELTLFHLGDIVGNHPGNQQLALRLPELRQLADSLQGKARRGVPFYKPAGSESSENMYLADYLGMVGLPILPTAEYPARAVVAFLPVQAAADPDLAVRMRRHLKRGATLVTTPALLRQLGPGIAGLAGLEIAAQPQPASTSEVRASGKPVSLIEPLQLDAGAKVAGCETLVEAVVDGTKVPWLTRQSVGRGQLVLLNVRTFSEADFGASGEWLLPPAELGLPRIPQALADTLRRLCLIPLGVDFQAPSEIGLFLFGPQACLYSFREDAAQVALGGKSLTLPPHGLVWVKP